MFSDYLVIMVLQLKLTEENNIIFKEAVFLPPL